MEQNNCPESSLQTASRNICLPIFPSDKLCNVLKVMIFIKRRACIAVIQNKLLDFSSLQTTCMNQEFVQTIRIIELTLHNSLLVFIHLVMRNNCLDQLIRIQHRDNLMSLIV